MKTNGTKKTRLAYSKPFMRMEVFEPQYYCDGCFEYEAELYCKYAINNGQGGTSPDDTNVPWGHRSGACGISYIKVRVNKGDITWVGEETYDPTNHGGNRVNLTAVNIPGIENMSPGSTFDNATWESVYNEYTWHHAGNGKVTAWNMTWAGHPNHS